MSNRVHHEEDKDFAGSANRFNYYSISMGENMLAIVKNKRLDIYTCWKNAVKNLKDSRLFLFVFFINLVS